MIPISDLPALLAATEQELLQPPAKANKPIADEANLQAVFDFYQELLRK